MTCSLICGLAGGGRRPLGLRPGEGIERAVGQPLRLVAPVDHDFAGQLDGLRIGGVQEKHRRGGARVEALLVPCGAAGRACPWKRRRSRCRPGRATRTCGTPCSGRRHPTIRPNAGPRCRGGSAPRRETPRSAARWPESCRAANTSRFARGTWVAHTGLHLPQRRQSLMASEIVLMSDCCMISDSWPNRLKLGV